MRTHFEDSPFVHSRCRERVQNVAWRSGSTARASGVGLCQARLARPQRVFYSLAVGESLHHDGACVHVLHVAREQAVVGLRSRSRFAAAARACAMATSSPFSSHFSVSK